jgi:hypothetical protein
MTFNPPDTGHPDTRTWHTGESSSIPAAARNGSTLTLARLGAFPTALAVVAVSTALPTLRTHLHVSLSDLGVPA